MKIDLLRESYKWKIYINGDITYFSCGYFYFGNKLYAEEKIIYFLIHTGIDTLEKLNVIIQEFNGCFSIIISKIDKTILAVDKMRTYPLLYACSANNSFVTDDISTFKDKHKLTLQPDDIISEQYLCSTFVIGPYTFYKNVYSVEAGQIIEISEQSVLRRHYFRWLPNMKIEKDFSIGEETKKLDHIFLKVMKRMVESAPNVNNWIIPLSGGYDSRILVNYLYRLGVKNVICFSYGMKDNIQSVISKTVAKALGYEWYFVDFSDEKVKSISKRDFFEELLDYTNNATSTPFLQDFPAIHSLYEDSIINDSDIVVPGHALDSIAGSHLREGMINSDDLETQMSFIKKHFSGFGYAKRSENLLSYIKSIISLYGISNNQIPEYFNWSERQTKFIANGVRCYDYIGLDWRLPLWDDELIFYWMEKPFNCRLNRRLFLLMVEKYNLLDDCIASTPYANNIGKRVPYKNRFLSRVPYSIKVLFRKLGYSKSEYYVEEGSHVLYFSANEKIKDYLKKNSLPLNIKKYLESYPSQTKIKNLNLNSVSTIKLINKIYSEK